MDMIANTAPHTNKLIHDEQSNDKVQKCSLIEKFDLSKDDDGQVSSKIDTVFIGNSDAAKNVKQMIILCAKSSCPILITGPSGSGKEVTAKAIHALSARSDKPLISINCGAIPTDLIESELFGHCKGAFTGAHKDYVGLFEQANGGTLFLDEIGEMPLCLQVRLLRVLEDSIIRAIGGKEKKLDVRIIAATNMQIGHAIGKNKFREDLFYRLSILSIDMPSLAQRRDDIADLVDHFMGQISNEPIMISDAAWNILLDHKWHGNVRELRNWVSRAALFDSANIIDAQRVRTLIAMGSPRYHMHQETAYYDQSNIVTTPLQDSAEKLKNDFNLREHVMSEEQKYMRIALSQSNDVIAKAAKAIGLKRTTFVEKMKRYNMN